MSERDRLFDVVRYHDDCRTETLVVRNERPAQAQDIFVIKGTEGFVEEENLWPGDERAQEREHLLFTTGERVRI